MTLDGNCFFVSRKKRKEAVKSNFEIICEKILEEAHKDHLKSFAMRVDKEYEKDWTEVSSYLLFEFFTEFKTKFPSIHIILASIISTWYFREPLMFINEGDENVVSDDKSNGEDN